MVIPAFESDCYAFGWDDEHTLVREKALLRSPFHGSPVSVLCAAAEEGEECESRYD